MRFAQVELSILSDPGLTDVDKTVYSVLVAHRNSRHGKAWPKRKTIAELVGVHVGSVSRATAKLVECGYLVKTEGRGRGKTTIYTFPLADARVAQRQVAAQARPEAKPEPKVRQPRAERRAELEKSNSTVPFFSPSPIEGTEDLKNNQPQTPSYSVAEPLPEAVQPCGESPCEMVPVPEKSEESTSESPQATATQETTQPRLAFPEALQAILCIQLARLLAGIPIHDAQAIVDEMAWNSRHRTIHNPMGYARSLLNRYRTGRFKAEVAHFEQQRREHQQRIQASHQANEQRHLAALKEGKLPVPPPPPTQQRTEEQKATAIKAFEAMRAARFNPEQRELARLQYLAAKLGRHPALGESKWPDNAGMAACGC